MSLFKEAWTPIASSRQELSVEDSVVTLTIPDGCSGCRIQVLGDPSNTTATNAVRVTFDGTTPETTVGMIFGDLDIIELSNLAQMQGFKAIQAEAAKTNTLEVYYYSNAQ